MPQIQERYRPLAMAADATQKLVASANIACFIAKTSGAITVVNSAGATVVDAIPVTAGGYLPLPFLLAGGGGDSSVVLSGGASGTLGVY